MGSNCVCGEIVEIESMYPTFDMPLKLYGKYDVKLEYEASTMITTVYVNGKYIELGDLTGIKLPYGFKSMYPENLEHDFRLLDSVLKQME